MYHLHFKIKFISYMFMFKRLILFKKLNIKQIHVKSRVLRVLYTGKIQDYVVLVVYVYWIHVHFQNTRFFRVQMYG